VAKELLSSNWEVSVDVFKQKADLPNQPDQIHNHAGSYFGKTREQLLLRQGCLYICLVKLELLGYVLSFGFSK
jgi:hypothetical protein